ncbi:FAD synthase [bacterium]|nr:FAD synthase [bacterium]
MKKVMVFGTFDIFHSGHKNFLKQAKSYGDYLIAIIARDKTVLKVKNNLPRNNESSRLNTIKKSSFVDEVILGNLGDKYEIIKKNKPDVICLGYDQKFFINRLKEKLEEFKLSDTVIIKMKPYHPEIYKSSKIHSRR